MIHRVSGFIKAGLKARQQTILFAAVTVFVPLASNAQGISARPGMTLPAPRQPISNPGVPNPAPSSNPVCVRLEGQLTALTQGSVDPARAEQIKRTEDAIAKQQADLDRTVAQAHKAGCAGQGFLAFFSALSPQCGPITSQIQQMRGNLDRMISDLEQLKNGNAGQEGQRRALIGQLAQNNCGAQYTAAANSWGGPQGFFDALFGGTIVNPGGDGAPLCPAAEAELYSFHNPGEDMQQAVSISGQAYSALPNAFRYRKEVVAGCSCRRPGQSWADALKNADDSSTLESGDIVVTDQNAKALSQPKPSGKQGASTPPASAVSAAAAPANPNATTSTGTDNSKRTVRTVGPPFLSSQSSSQSAPQSQ
jgi:hypothetical protein